MSPAALGLPVVDHHCHLSPSGEGVEAARRFRAAGGTHLFLATQSYGPAPPHDLAGYLEQFETTERIAIRVREEVGAKVYLVVSPFPVDLVPQVDALGAEAAERLHRDALDLAGRWVREGRAVALGEVGWPHFPTPPEVSSVAQRILDHALDVARDVGCPLVVHSPDLGAEGFHDLAERGRVHGVLPEKVIKHYARTAVGSAAREGVGASHLATRSLVVEALAQEPPWFLETDFLDDPNRPGAVLDLATIPRRASSLRARDPAMSDRLAVPFVDSVQRSYGFRPQLEEARSP